MSTFPAPCCRNKGPSAARQKNPGTTPLPRATSPRRDVPAMTDVALLQRQARVVVRHTLCLGLGERDPATLVIAHLALVEAGCSDVPTQVRTERRLQQHDRNTTDLIAIRVHSRYHLLDHLSDDRRLERMEAGILAIVQTGAPVVLHHRLDKLARSAADIQARCVGVRTG